MDEIKEVLTKKIRSSSLIEVTTALVIISLVFTLAILIYLGLQRSTSLSGKLLYHVKMDEVLVSSEKTSAFGTREVAYEDFTVYQEVEPYERSANLLVVLLEARDKGGKVLAEQKHLVYVPVIQP